MSNETKVYPEQENPPRPTYEANVRGIAIGGWLYYADDSSRLTTVVTIDGQRVAADDFHWTDAESRTQARTKAKNVWRSAVLAVLAGV